MLSQAKDGTTAGNLFPENVSLSNKNIGVCLKENNFQMQPQELHPSSDQAVIIIRLIRSF